MQLNVPIWFLLQKMENDIKKRNRQLKQAICVENPSFCCPYFHYGEYIKEKGHNSDIFLKIFLGKMTSIHIIEEIDKIGNIKGV